MEPGRISGKRANHRAEPVRIFPVKSRVLGQLMSDRRGLIRLGAHDLQGEPFVHDQPVGAPLGLELQQGLGAMTVAQQRRKCAHLLCHIVSARKDRAGAIPTIAP